MSFATAKAAIDFMYKRHLEVKEKEKGDKDYEKDKNLVENSIGLAFYGGEPLLRFDFIKKCITYFEFLDWGDKKLKHHFTTNGSLLSDKIINYLIKHKIRPLISIDGPKSEHDKNRVFEKNGNGSFDTVISNFKKMSDKLQNGWIKTKKPFNLGINCVISPSADLLEIKTFFSNLSKVINPRFSLTLSNVSSGNTLYFKKNPIHPERNKHVESLYKEYADALTNKKNMLKHENIFLENYIGKQFIDYVHGHYTNKAEDRVYSLSMWNPPLRKPYIT